MEQALAVDVKPFPTRAGVKKTPNKQKTLRRLKTQRSAEPVPEIVLRELVLPKAVRPCQCSFSLQDELSRALSLTNAVVSILRPC